MLFKSLLLPTMASLAYAESTVTSMFMYGADEQPLAASIVGNDASRTTYLVNCPPGTDSNDCGMGPGQTVIAGKDVTSWIFDEAPEFIFTAECSIKGTKAICTESAAGSDANFPGVFTSTTTVDYQPVTVTAGSITEVETGASSTGSGSSTGSAAQASETPSETTPRNQTESATETGEESTPTGGAVRLTGAAGVLALGVAVFMGLVL
ncbi:hypothetical protein BJX70DRAFT_357114 [Aspergillus crustosus]